ncbi:MAG TPA: hypothetical protein VFA65_16100 [Bryobacteraceae bacterium]|nr:hypothetical protein [Bryobacteraceae bacterium]
MALFTDTDVVTLNDLLQFESSLTQVSTTHSIDVETKITLAMHATGDKLMLWLLNAGASDPQWMQRRVLGLSTVVVTPTLFRWICFDSLSRFFAEAYNVQLNTRFQGKWTEYQQQAQEAADMVFMSGLGIVYNPLPEPAMAAVTTGAGALLAESFFAQTTWVDSKGNESTPSPVNGQLLQNFSSVTVLPVSAATQPPAAAVGWNLYASTTNAKLTLQNATPLRLGSSWQLSRGGLIAGSVPSGGQQPDFYLTLSKRILRG